MTVLVETSGGGKLRKGVSNTASAKQESKRLVR